MLRPAAPYNNLLSGDERLEDVRPYFDGTYTGRVLFLKSGVGYHKECLYQFLKAQILQPAVWNGVEEQTSSMVIQRTSTGIFMTRIETGCRTKIFATFLALNHTLSVALTWRN